MEEKPTELAAPRFENERELLIAGSVEHYTMETSPAIPSQWQRFGPYIGRIPGQVGSTTYGVIVNDGKSDSFDYWCGVETADLEQLPPGLAGLRIPAQRYAIFFHSSHISKLRGTLGAIFGRWLPNSGHRKADAPFLERYDERFDARSGNGGLEILIPLAAGSEPASSHV